jgi:hypothetical protein
MPLNYPEALGLVRILISSGASRDVAINNSAIPEDFRGRILEDLQREDIIVLEPAHAIVAEQNREEWLGRIDRSHWYYWPVLRQYLFNVRRFSAPAVRSLDEITDKILGQIADPNTDHDRRGLVLGYVQSGKTANYTALIAKAADVGYRFIIVLSGIDNGLRLQTQNRLDRELVGYPDRRPNSVPFPPLGHQWHQFTIARINGDFRQGFANHAALQGSQPVLLVVKKNGTVLRRLHGWIDGASDEIKRTIPLLVIDDEADQASVDTRGSHQTEDDPEDGEDPSVINGLIRDLLRKFQRSSYVAYTATPFANILIPHDAFNPQFSNDLFPSDFIIKLPKPQGYFGAEELFGINGDANDQQNLGLDVVRTVADADVDLLEQGDIPPSLNSALIDFILSGAARAHRGNGDSPATMLIHVSRRIFEQNRIAVVINQRFQEMRDDWRYQRQQGFQQVLAERWENEFREVTRSAFAERDVTFEQIDQFIGPFFESVSVRVINSETGDVLDYEQNPRLKAIVIGGDRLSRGLTLEGLSVSYFVRRSVMYDTLMQMGRWFGFRGGYEDLTRIYTTDELAGWFSDLAFVEHQLRQDIQIYEELGLTPLRVGTRIWQHPVMAVTSQLKSRHAQQLVISQSYSGERTQTFRFPLKNLDAISRQEDHNLTLVKSFLSSLGAPHWEVNGPTWSNISGEQILTFLQNFNADLESGLFVPALIQGYIERQIAINELTNWAVVVSGRGSKHTTLGEADWEVPGGHIWQIRRTRLSGRESLGVITNPGDEAYGLSEEEKERMQHFIDEGNKQDIAARMARSPDSGLLLLYPISKQSGYESTCSRNREPLYENPENPLCRDLIGLALSFPESQNAQPVEAYLTGTAGWRTRD